MSFVLMDYWKCVPKCVLWLNQLCHCLPKPNCYLVHLNLGKIKALLWLIAGQWK